MSRTIAECDAILNRLEREEKANPTPQTWQQDKLYIALRAYAAQGDMEAAYEIGIRDGLTNEQVDIVVGNVAKAPEERKPVILPVKSSSDVLHQFRKQTLPTPKPSPLAKPVQPPAAKKQFDAAVARFISQGLTRSQALCRLVLTEPKLHKQMLAEVNQRAYTEPFAPSAADVATISKFQTMIADEMATHGIPRRTAVARLVKAQPALHEQYIAAINR